MRSSKFMTYFKLAVAIIAAPFLPLAGIGVIDRILERRHEEAA